MDIRINRGLLPTWPDVHDLLNQFGSRLPAAIKREQGLLPFTIDGVQGVERAAGVYIVFTEGKRLTYIGMSERNMRGRLLSHLSVNAQRSRFWIKNPGSTCVALYVSEPWIAPALEAYLTYRVREYTAA